MSSISPASPYQLNTASQDGTLATKAVQSDSQTVVAAKTSNSSSTDKVTLSPEAKALLANELSVNAFNGGGVEPPAPGDNGGGVEPPAPNPNPPGPTDQQAQAFNGGGIEPPKK